MKSANMPKLIVVAVVVAVTFFLALTLVEAIPEIPVDIDFKPFFIPMVFAALVPKAWGPLLAVGLGGMLGEFLRDLLEGYEIDDPIGAVGYVVGFVAGGYIVGDRPNQSDIATAIERAVVVGYAALDGSPVAESHCQIYSRFINKD